jgi:DNA-binding MarR family transcriptional regulator
MSKRHNNTGRTEKDANHIRLYRWLRDSAAWQTLNPVERATYLELKFAYWGTNNGRIQLSVRTLADTLKIGKSTATRALTTLRERGFIAAMSRGHFDRKARHCSEWRLTEHSCDVKGALSTKEFMQWQPGMTFVQLDGETNLRLRRWPPETQKPVPVAGLAGPRGVPIGTRSGPAVSNNRRYGT